MKNIIVFILLLSHSAYGTISSNLLLKAQVAKKVSLEISPLPIATALDLTTTAVNLLVAKITEHSNSKTGYKLTIISANLGKLKRDNGTELFTYNLKLDGTSLNLSSSAGRTINRSNKKPVSINRNLTISYTGKTAESLIEGTYSDTLTIQIASK